jgi:hypothetical protein
MMSARDFLPVKPGFQVKSDYGKVSLFKADKSGLREKQGEKSKLHQKWATSI